MKPTLFEGMNLIDLAIESMEKRDIDKDTKIGEVKKSIYLSHQNDLDSLNLLDLSGKFGTIENAVKAIEKCGGIKNYKDMNFAEAQKEVILNYGNNTLMTEVLSGKSTLEEISKDISGVYKGIKFILPHTKNEEHNQRVENLMKLIPNSFYSKTRGVFYPDNFVTMSAYAFAGFYALTSYIFGGITPSESTDPDALERVKMGIYGITTVASIIMGIVSNGRRLCSGTKPEVFAKYIDSKVKELGLLEDKQNGI